MSLVWIQSRGWISCQCNAAERLPRRGPSPSLSSYFAQSDDRVLIRKRWLLNPLFSSAVLVVCVNQGLSETSGISGISIRTGQLFLCGYTTAGSLLIAPDTQPNISRYRPPVKGCVVSVGLCSSAPTHLQTSYLFCSVGKTNQSWSQPSGIPSDTRDGAFPWRPFRCETISCR